MPTFKAVKTTFLKDIRELEPEEISLWLSNHGEKPFRAKQIHDWLWKKQAVSFDEMSDLSLGLRDKLTTYFELTPLMLSEQQISSDRTIKCAFCTHDQRTIEGVLIPTATRMTACISSQVGCSLSCAFCATGRLKLMRNLTAGEIVDQVVYLRKLASEKYNTNLTNIVYMGMGEPLLNYKNVMRSVDLLTSDKGLGISPRRITLSTAGIAKMIKRLGDDQTKVNLALSLHAANDSKRTEIMDINESNNLEVLQEALRYFHEKTGTRVTFEYIIFNGFNDELTDASELAAFAKCVPCKINIIEYNPIDEGRFQQAKREKVDAFAGFLTAKNMIVNIRRSRGKDIDAACGQLANKNSAITDRSTIFKQQMES
jgi:23S rRNA (adenine2503-C2)-methyltransferase